MRTGTTKLPLHGGKCPPWLFQKMQNLAGLIVEAVLLEFSSAEMLKRLSDPYWFQGLGCVLGFDWHSSGLTTTTCAALKEGIKGKEKELGFFIAGGKGKTALQTPHEIEILGTECALDNNLKKLQYTSRLVAKVDNAAMQDGFDLYQHCLFFNSKGDWAVVQQGMDGDNSWARRYHWLREEVEDFVSRPHSAICSDYQQRNILNLVSPESKDNRENSLELSRETPEKVLKEWASIKKNETTLNLPRSHPLPQGKKIFNAFKKAYEEQSQSYQQLLGIKGIGPQSLRALSLIAELSFGSIPDRRDPARYSFAHGGKDGHPYPVNKETFEHSIHVLQEAVNKSKIGENEKMHSLKRLGQFAQQRSSD